MIEVGPDKLVIIKDHVTVENAEEMLIEASTNSRSTLREMYPTAYTAQNSATPPNFAVACGKFFFALQELLVEKPELRKHILLVNSTIEDLKEKL